MTDERAEARECNDASVIRGGGLGEQAEAHGRYEIECIGADGRLKWRETIDNVVCDVGKNLALDSFLAGAAYTVVGPYMGLISATSYTAVAAGDTMASHVGLARGRRHQHPGLFWQSQDRSVGGGERRIEAAIGGAIVRDYLYRHGEGRLPLPWKRGAQHEGQQRRGAVVGRHVLDRRQGGGERGHTQRAIFHKSLIFQRFVSP